MSLLLTLNISHLFVVFLLLSLEFGCVFVYWVLTLGSFKMYVTSKMAFFIPPMSRSVILFSNSLLLCFRGTKSWVAEKMSTEKFLVIGITYFTVLSPPYIAFCYFSHEPSSPLPEWCTSWMIPCSSKPRFFGSFFQGYLCDLSS